MRNTKLFFLVVLYPLFLFAEGGGSEGHGGGSALAHLFKSSWKGSLYVLENFPGDPKIYVKCSPEVYQWISYEHSRLKGVLESHPPVWLSEEDESSLASKGTLQSECATLSRYNVVLSEQRCKPKALQRKNAIQILLSAAFEAEPYFMSGNQSSAVAECYAELIDKKMVDYTAATEDAKELRDELRKLTYGLEHSEQEKIAQLKEDIESARVHSSGVLRALFKAAIPSSVEAHALQWIKEGQRAAQLADDIEKTKDVFIMGLNPGGSCAWTTSGSMDTVYFSIPICLNNIRSKKDAYEAVIHESTHHAPFSIKSELEAERLAVNLAKIAGFNQAKIYQSDDLRRAEILRKAAQIDGMIEDLTGEKTYRPEGVIPTREELIGKLDRVIGILKGMVSKNLRDLEQVHILADRIRANGGVVPSSVQATLDKCERQNIDFERYVRVLEKLKEDIVKDIL